MELVGIGLIDEETDQKADYRYWAVWRLPSDEMAKKFETQVREDGFYENFEQVNARRRMSDPGEVFSTMIRV